ncbi:dipeptide/oligopeptide/nickel ABC transporter permease/ATP-binding protein [Streptomyces sp. NPDC049906]|uniref:dipeptide/oligopeptide/nickel ABC transporter permease/ATP-binding protein n=1 Tax=Streptomyces sp. NPDC049906 TaxID=3155656 RepID=UPI003417D014
MTAATIGEKPPGTEGAAPGRARRKQAGVLSRTVRQPIAVICLALLLIQVLVALTAGFVAPHDPIQPDVSNRFQGPSAEHLLGTDDLGRDILSRLIYGTRTALIAAFQSVGIGVVLGVGLGLLVGYLGGWWDRIGMRIADVMQAIPALLMALALVAIIGNGLVKAMFAVGLVFAVSFMRITRAVVLAERERLYVDAARVSGLRTPAIMLRQILPNIAAPVIVQASIALGTALLIEAMLSFLGVGIDTTQVSWGGMLDASRAHFADEPMLAVYPGVAITLSVLMYNLLGDCLRDATARRTPFTRKHRKAFAALKATRAAQAAEAKATAPLTAVKAVGAEAPLLRIEGLTVTAIQTPGGPADLVSEVSFDIARGEAFGLVGESGSGKSITASTLLGLLPRGVEVSAGSVTLDGTELVGLSEREWGAIRGKRIGMVFQDPMSALSPVHTIGDQLVDGIRAHSDMSRGQARERAAELLSLVGVPDPQRRLDDYPHQFSGGMAQRVVIAAALASEPELLVADEPTTALDVTIQAQVLELLSDLRERLNMSLLIITHDLGVVADVCDRVGVMYAGQVVEVRDVRGALGKPKHPYTEALLSAMPQGSVGGAELATIPGRVPAAWEWPQGCRFNPRCEYATAACTSGPVPITDGVRCVRAGELRLVGTK